MKNMVHLIACGNPDSLVNVETYGTSSRSKFYSHSYMHILFNAS